MILEGGGTVDSLFYQEEEEEQEENQRGSRRRRKRKDNAPLSGFQVFWWIPTQGGAQANYLVAFTGSREERVNGLDTK